MLEPGYALQTDIPMLREIWLQCFGGPEQYLDFYYENRFSPRETLVIREGSRPVAMMTMMNVSIDGIKGCYVYAVATLPWFQGMGLQRKLDAFACQEMKKRGAAFSCLVPAEPGLFELYRKLGYENGFDRWEKRIPVEDLGPSGDAISFRRCSYTRFQALRRGYLAGLPHGVYHPDRSLRYIYRELEGFQGGVASFEEDGSPCYAAYSLSGDGELYVREQTGSDPERTARCLLSAVGEKVDRLLVTGAAPFPGAVRKPFGMIRFLKERLWEPAEENAYMALMLDG